MRGTRLFLACLVTLALAAGCEATSHGRAVPQLLSFECYGRGDDPCVGVRLVRLEPRTLRPVPGSGMKLGAVGSDPVLSPDRRLMALVGSGPSSVDFFDIARRRRAGSVRFGRGPDGIRTIVRPLAWPRSDRALVQVEEYGGGTQPNPDSLALVDPLRRRLLRLTPLGGSIIGSTHTAHGETVLLVDRVDRRAAPLRLMVVGAGGRLRGVALLRFPGSRYCPNSPGLAVEGARVLVIGAGETIAAVDSRTLAVSYHRVPNLMRAELPRTPVDERGGFECLASRRAAQLTGPHRLLVTGTDSYPVGIRVRRVTRAAEMIDTRRWRVVHVFAGVGSVRPFGNLLLGSAAQMVHEKFTVGASLVVLHPDGVELYRKRNPYLLWDIVAGRLLAVYGSRLVQLDAHTGRVKERIVRSPHNWPLKVLVWTPPARK